MENRIDSFIAEHGLDENAKDAVIELVNGCFTDYISHMAKEWLKNPVKSTKEPTPKSKKAKLEDPTQAESPDDLMNCTTAILNEYCKNNKIKVGGNKKELSGRVWRHIQGESSDDDTSSRSKPKSSKPKKETHQCFACNSKGAPCGISGTEEYSGEWFCFHHIDSAEELINNKTPSAPEPETKKKSKKAESKPKKSKSPKKSSDESEEDELESE